MTSTQVTLRDLAETKGLVGGPFGSSLVNADYVPDGVPVIRGSNLTGGPWIGGDFACVTRAKFERDLSRNTAQPGDVVYTQRGTLGQVALVPPEPHDVYVISQSQMRLRVDPAMAEPKYVYYACNAEPFRKQISDRAITTGVPHINLGILGDLSIPLPSVESQRAIAEVLGALDDKIAANLTVADTALRLAEAKFLDARGLGAISARTFGDMADVSGGGTPRTSVDEYWNGDVMWATPTDVTALAGPFIRATARRITEQGLAACASALHPAGSILMTSRATIGAFAIAQVPIAVNQGFIVVNTKGDVPQWWLFHEMRSRVDEFISHANGATFLELSRGKFKQFQVHLADTQVMERFADSAEALHATGAAVLSENEVLARTRDELLPLLMSGKVRVRDAEKVVEGVV